MKKSKPERKRPPELDPILPLPAGTGIPYLREGEGKVILDNDTPVVIEMTRRAAWIMWEQAEALAKRSYAKNVKGPFRNHAEAILEACYGFRNEIHTRTHDMPLKKLSEERAQKAREILNEMKAQEAQEAKRAGKGRREAQSGQNQGSEANPAKKKERCTARLARDGENTQCVGPKGHKGNKHKDKHGRRWVL